VRSGKPLAGSTLNRYLTQAGSVFKHARRLRLVPRAFVAPTRGIERANERPDEAVLDDMQRRLDHQPEKMRLRRQTAEHPFGTIKFWMGSTHFLTKTLARVSTEMSLHVLAYNLKRVIHLLGTRATMAAMRA
jgi:hypothetical protein